MELSHAARDWLRRVRRAGRQFLRAASVAAEEYRIRYELTACLKFKNEAPFLPEWIEFHQIVGFEHFYLYNNNSTDNYREALAPYCEEGSVTLYEWPDVPAFPKSDEHCIAHHRHEARWIAFLDADEFLFPVNGTDVRKILRRYESYPALAVHWLMFGSSGHVCRPDGLVLENYQHCQRDVSPTIKSIINPRRVEASRSPHHWLYKNHELASDENASRCPDARLWHRQRSRRCARIFKRRFSSGTNRRISRSSTVFIRLSNLCQSSIERGAFSAVHRSCVPRAILFCPSSNDLDQ